MKYFLFPLVIGLMIVAGLNLYIDPSGRWRPLKYNFTANWNQDQVWVAPLRIEERELRLRQIELMPKIDILALGSSRLFPVDSSMFPAGVNLYNASVSGATAWDYVALWEKTKQARKIPKHIIIYVDTWNFNKNTWQKYRWTAIAPLALDFLNDGGKNFTGSTAVQITALIDWLSGNFYEFSDLFSPAVLKVSLQEMQIRYRGAELKTNYISNFANRPTDFPAWKNDGSYVYPQGDNQQKSLAEINDIGRNIGMGSMYVYMKDWETDKISIQLFNYFFADAKEHGVDVLLVQPPFQHEAFAALKNNAEYKEIPDIYSTIMSSFIASHENVSYCDMLNPRMAMCDATEFMDSSHTLKSCAKKIVATCLLKVPKWFTPADN